MWYDLLIIGNDPIAREVGLLAARQNQLVGWVEDPKGWIEETIARQLSHPFTASTSPQELEQAANLLREQVCEKMARAGVDVLSGEPRFNSPNQLELDYSGRELKLQAKKILIATGTRLPQGQAMASEVNQVLVIGEHSLDWQFATWLTLQGKSVTFLEVLGNHTIERKTQRERTRFGQSDGKILTGFSCTSSIPSCRTPAIVEVQPISGGRIQTLQCDAVIDLRGRVGNTRHLNCATAEIGVDERGLLWCNDRLQTWNSQVFGVGDVVGFSGLSEESPRQILRTELLGETVGRSSGESRLSRSLLRT